MLNLDKKLLFDKFKYSHHLFTRKMYGHYTEKLHANHLTSVRVDLSSRVIISLPFCNLLQRKNLLVDRNVVEMEFGISIGMDTGMDQWDKFEGNKTKIRIFDQWNYNLHYLKEMATTRLKIF